MTTYLYINADPVAGPARATALGCGWMASAPAQFARAVTSLPAVVVAGQGIVTVLSDSPPTTAAAVANAAAPIVAAEQASAAAQVDQASNQSALRQLAQAALAANPADVAQDQAIQTQAATITAASITNLAAAATAIGKLAQAVSLLAGNDINTKKELQALVRLVLQQFDSTAGT